jgi:hypothetical protein
MSAGADTEKLLPFALCAAGSANLFFHPAVQNCLLELPPVAQLERGDLGFVNVAIKRVRRNAQVLGSLADVHHFARFNRQGLHPKAPEAHRPAPLPHPYSRESPAGWASLWAVMSPRVRGCQANALAVVLKTSVFFGNCRVNGGNTRKELWSWRGVPLYVGLAWRAPFQRIFGPKVTWSNRAWLSSTMQFISLATWKFRL